MTTIPNYENMNDRVIDSGGIIAKEQLPKPVYYIESSCDNTVLVGIDVTIRYNRLNRRDIAKIIWHDTTHERIMTASEIKRENDGFSFKRADREGGGYYYFAPMNLKIYNEKVKQRLISGADFTNEDDLIKAFLSTARTSFN